MTIQLHPMKEVKIIIQGEHLGYVTDLLESIGSTGYTVIPTISSKGHHGHHVSNPMTNEMENLDMLLAVIPEEKLDPLLEGLTPIFEKYTGVIFVFDALVNRKAYFTGEENG